MAMNPETSAAGRMAAFAALFALFLGPLPTLAADLPSWNEGPAKAAIVAFVEDVTAEGGGSFVPVEERIAVFDNDGTLWSEQPVYFQLFFALDRAKELGTNRKSTRLNSSH